VCTCGARSESGLQRNSAITSSLQLSSQAAQIQLNYASDSTRIEAIVRAIQHSPLMHSTIFFLIIDVDSIRRRIHSADVSAVCI
jgi:hypothetical protein